jgi:parallel beta-helix repeat protein
MQFQAATTSGESYNLSGQHKGQYRKLVRLSVSPVSSIVSPEGTQTFRASALLSDGSTLVVPLTWNATGGSVDASGKYTAGTTPGKFQVTATAPNGLADTAVVTVSLAVPIVAQLMLSPANVALSPDGSQQFLVEGRSADSATVGVSPIYTATGGTITAQGFYTAGSTPGSFQVVATDTTSGIADTSVVTVVPPAPTLQAVVLTPTTAALQVGATQQFAASGQLNDGNTTPVTVIYSATGGSITSGGLYTAGSSAGTYRVVATLAGGSLADTSAINITAPAPAPAPAPPAPTGVPIQPGQSIQSAVDANSQGTTFLIKAGRHVRQSVLPKNGDTFRCESGAILDGETVTSYAFKRSGAGPDNVTIIGCIIERYAPPAQMGAILAGGHTPADGTTGWVVDSSEVRNNANLGIRLGHQMKVRWSYIHHNGTLGVGGVGDDILIEGNEIAYMNPNRLGNLDFETGGTKFVLTHRLVVRNNFVHHNYGEGLWTDIDNLSYVFEGNTCEDNWRAGISTEISGAGIIRNNILRRNGLSDTRSWLWGGGIQVSSSKNVEVYNNLLEGNKHGITVIQQSRGSGTIGDYIAENVYVHDNTVTQPSGMTGIVQDVGDNAIFTSRNNRFERNKYLITGNTRPFAWMNGARTEQEWKAYGQDVNGTFTR